MPQVFKIGSYWVYFWANENEPLEPIHVHVAQGAPSANATKIWITRAGKCYLSNSKQRTPGGGTDLACMMGRETTLERVKAAIEKLNG